MDKRLTTGTGISLLEVLISMVILGVGILGLAPLMMVSLDSNSESRDLSLATQLAKDKMELLESLDTLPAMPFTENETAIENKFARATYITDHASDSLIPPDRYKVLVQVSWLTDANLARSTQMSTLMRKG